MMCPCHSGKAYSECCKRYHEGTAAPTPLTLMRSRYSAYALKNIDYIIETAVQPTRSKEELVQFAASTSFDDLTILDAKANFVTFRAHLTQNGQDISFTEKSRFERIDGRWKYDSGVLS